MGWARPLVFISTHSECQHLAGTRSGTQPGRGSLTPGAKQTPSLPAPLLGGAGPSGAGLPGQRPRRAGLDPARRLGPRRLRPLRAKRIAARGAGTRPGA